MSLMAWKNSSFQLLHADTIHVLFNVTCISFVFIISADGFMTQDLHHYA
jgi:hypothetical protein